MNKEKTEMPDSGGDARRSQEGFFMPSYWTGEIDTRWIAVFRILLGLLLLKDAIYHLPLAHVFYSDDGVIPRRVLFDGLVRDTRFSLMDAIGQTWMAQLFFLLWIIVLVLLIIGYRVRLMTILNFILILSVHERNGYILTSADTLMRAMSFWLMFAPAGQYYSLDAIRKRWRHYRETGAISSLRLETEPRTSFALPVRMIQLQLVIVYISTAYLKTIGPIWKSGEAMHYVTQIETFALPLNFWMRTWSPELLKALSYFTVYAEIAIPVLLLMPFAWRFSRLLAFILALILHGGIAVSLSIQDFSILMLICYLPFFDPAWLQWLEDRFRKSVHQITMPRPMRLDSPLWMWLSITSPDQVLLLDTIQEPQHEDDWSIEIEGQSQTGVDAWQIMSSQVAFSGVWRWVLRFKTIRRLLWQLNERLIHHYRNKPLIPRPVVAYARRNRRILLSAFLIPVFALLVLFNIEETASYLPDGFRYPPPVEMIQETAGQFIWYSGLWQYWDMFSPTPIQYDAWFIVEGQFEDNTSYDLFTGKPVDYDTPTRWYWGSQMRWEKYEENVGRGTYDALLRGWASYYCRTINREREYGERLMTLEIVFVSIAFHSPEEIPRTYQQDQMWFHWCYDEFAPQG